MTRRRVTTPRRGDTETGLSAPTAATALRSAGVLPGRVQAARQALVATGWTIDGIDEDGSWFRATRDAWTVDIAIDTTSPTAARFDPALAAGKTRVVVTGR